jgi:hypothetical protein
MVFFLHGQTLYSWVQLNKESSKIRKVSNSSCKLQACSSEQFYFSDIQKVKGSKQIIKQEIKLIDTFYSTYGIKTIYKEMNISEKFKAFNVD